MMKILIISIALYCTFGCVSKPMNPVEPSTNEYNTCDYGTVEPKIDCTLVA